MDDIFDQIMGTLDAGFPYAAIVMAVAVPDICAHLRLPPEAKEKDGQKKRYIRWYDQHLMDALEPLTGNDCYSIRCGVLHMGRFGNDKQRFDKVGFLADSENRFGRMHIDNSLVIETRYFCETVIGAAKAWLASCENDRDVQKNLERLVRYRPEGLSPVVRGIPVIG